MPFTGQKSIIVGRDNRVELTFTEVAGSVSIELRALDGTLDMDALFLTLSDRADGLMLQADGFSGATVTDQVQGKGLIDQVGSMPGLRDGYDFGAQFSSFGFGARGTVTEAGLLLSARDGSALKLADIATDQVAVAVNAPDGRMLALLPPDEAGGPYEAVLDSEAFDTVTAPTDSDMLVRSDGWRVEGGRLTADGTGDGWLITQSYLAEEAVQFEIDLRVGDPSAFEARGADADRLLVQARVDGGRWQLLDRFTLDETTGLLTGNLTGQTIGAETGTLSYGGGMFDGSGEKVQFRVFADLNGTDEQVDIDALRVLALSETDPEVTLASEDFTTFDRPSDSSLIARATGWEAADGAVTARGEGTPGWDTLQTVQVEAEAAMTLSFDISVADATAFEARGAGRDLFDVLVRAEGERWQMLERFTYDETAGLFVGNETGQSFGEDATTLRFDGGALAEGGRLQVMVRARLTDADEQLTLDNLVLSAEAAEADPDIPEPQLRVIDFDTGPEGEALSHGTLLDHGFRIGDVTFDTPSSNNPFGILDTSDPAGMDQSSTDMITPDQGNALIVTRYADQSSFEEKAGDTDFHLTFDEEVTLLSLVTMDNEMGGAIRLYGGDGTLLNTVDIPEVPDGREDAEASLQTIEINTAGVQRVEFDSPGSTFIDDITYLLDTGIPPEEDGDEYELTEDAAPPPVPVF